MNCRTRLVRVAVAVGLTLALAACGDTSSTPNASPVAPTAAAPAPPSSAGATISGTVAVSSTLSQGVAGLHASTSYAIVVSVAGTSISTAADGAGRFKLTGVPPGTVELRFSGGGMQGNITLTGVKDADDISVAVTLSSSGASLDAEQTDAGNMVEIEGRIAALTPGGAANTVLVDSTTVSIPSTAAIRHGSTVIAFGDLQVGDRIHVMGTKSGSTVVATEVMVQNDNATVPVNISGDVTDLAGGFSCPAIRFTVAGWTVDTDASTSFQKGPCSGIAKGTSVHVMGTVQSSGRVLATWVQTGK